MITKDTAARIAFAYSGIEAAENLLSILASTESLHDSSDFREAYGHWMRALELGVPSNERGHRLCDVSAPLAEIIIKAHIEGKRAEIAELCELATTELMMETK
jgi:hypothetical protein